MAQMKDIEAFKPSMAEMVPGGGCQELVVVALIALRVHLPFLGSQKSGEQQKGSPCYLMFMKTDGNSGFLAHFSQQIRSVIKTSHRAAPACPRPRVATKVEDALTENDLVLIFGTPFMANLDFFWGEGWLVYTPMYPLVI